MQKGCLFYQLYYCPLAATVTISCFVYDPECRHVMETLE